MIAFFKDGYIALFLYQDKSVGDISCFYHILSQDAFVTNSHTCILKNSSKTCISCSLEKRDR